MNTERILRVTMFGVFLGHGVFAWQRNPEFLELLAAMTGISGKLAGTLLQVIGAGDMLIASIVLIKPIRIVLAWASLWGLLTTIAQPVAGDPVWEFLQHLANFGVPLALLSMRGFPKTMKEWFL